MFTVSSRPVVVGAELIPTTGPVLVAATHSSPYDVPVLIRHSPRVLDFISSTEVFANPLVARFLGALNAFPLDRSRPDPRTALIAVRRLKSGRAVAMFPEGRICSEQDSVIRSGKVRPGFARLAEAGGACVVPAVIIGAERYGEWTAWLPVRRTRYGVMFGAPMAPGEGLEQRFVAELRRLHAALLGEMSRAAPDGFDHAIQPGNPS